MKTPPYLNSGDKIRIISPAGKVKEEFVQSAAEWLRKQSFNVVLGQHVFSRHFQFAGTDRERLEDLQVAFDDQETKAIFCARGGYGTIRIMDKLDLTSFLKYPKWLIGFSDITILHTFLNNNKVATIHGVMPRYFFDDAGLPNDNLQSLMQIISGRGVSYTFPASEKNRPGIAVAELIGGNLSILSSLQGTNFEISTDGKILFLEDTDEYLYHTDRMMHQLKLSGKLQHLEGLVVGNFTNVKDNECPFGKSIHEIIAGAVAEYNYPVCFDFPAGHDMKNMALVFGKTWELNVSEKGTIFKTDNYNL